jgi:hypothetical protein
MSLAERASLIPSRRESDNKKARPSGTGYEPTGRVRREWRISALSAHVRVASAREAVVVLLVPRVGAQHGNNVTGQSATGQRHGARRAAANEAG